MLRRSAEDTERASRIEHINFTPKANVKTKIYTLYN